MPISIYDLLQQVPSDTEQIVSRARTRFNASVRQILRQETGLRLTTGRGTEDETQETHAIRVYVEAGVPAQIEGMRFNDDKWLPILLAPRRSELQLLHRSTRLVGKDLISLLPKNITEEGCFAGIDEKLLTTHDFAEHLLKISQSFDLVKELHAVEDDILGEYRWGVDRQGQASASIRLYWGVIGLIARALGVSVEGMTVKVLAHELAHAYTHLGADIDGYRWSSKDFSNSK